MSRVVLAALIICLATWGKRVSGQTPINEVPGKLENTYREQGASYEGTVAIPRGEGNNLNCPIGATVQAWCSLTIQVITMAIGIWLVLLQIKRNHKSSLDLQIKQHQEELKLQLYGQLALQLSHVRLAIVEMHTEVRLLPSKITSYWKIVDELKIELEPVKTRAITLINMNSAVESKVLELMSMLENYEIALPQFKVFTKVFEKQLGICQKAFREFLDEAYRFLPCDVEEGKAKVMGLPKIIIPKHSTKEQEVLFQKLATNCADSYIQLTAFTIDLAVEVQNIILGGLFKRKLPPRAPKDKNSLVITSDSSNREMIDQFLRGDEKEE